MNNNSAAGPHNLAFGPLVNASGRSNLAAAGGNPALPGAVMFSRMTPERRTIHATNQPLQDVFESTDLDQGSVASRNMAPNQNLAATGANGGGGTTGAVNFLRHLTLRINRK